MWMRACVCYSKCIYIGGACICVYSVRESTFVHRRQMDEKKDAKREVNKELARDGQSDVEGQTHKEEEGKKDRQSARKKERQINRQTVYDIVCGCHCKY